MKFGEFKQLINQKPDREIVIYLPNNEIIPKHFHLTDIGTITHNFIDCGGVVGQNSWVQMQLWVADDIEHRITTTTLDHILHQSQEILNDVNSHNVVIEYQTSGGSATKYDIKNIEITDTFNIHLANVNTTCLEIERNPNTNKCGNNSSCCG
jgi:hypothetical protein